MGDTITEYESDSKPGQWHKIVRGKDGVVYCDCWAWRMNKRCKHLDRFFNDVGSKQSKSVVKQLNEAQVVGSTWSTEANSRVSSPSDGETAEKTSSEAAQVFDAIEQERGSVLVKGK